MAKLLLLRFLCGYEHFVLGAGKDASTGFCDLSQNPVERPCFSANGSLPCLRRSSRLWHCGSRRFVSCLELGAAMGLPTFEPLAKAAKVNLDPCRQLYSHAELGNGMHIACAGVVLGIGLACASHDSATL